MEKIKLNPLSSKARGLREIHISFAGHSIKKHKTVEYLDGQLEFKLSGEAMASKVLKKSNAKLKFLYRQSRQLTSAHRRLLCNKLITKHFNYGCSSWFLFFKEKFKTQTSKSPKLMCSLFPRFTSDISYRFITL